MSPQLETAERTFPDNPNPPPESSLPPGPLSISSFAAPSGGTEGGFEVPPESSAPAAAVAQPKAIFTVVGHDDGTHSLFKSTGGLDEDIRLRTVTIPDIGKVLDEVGEFNADTNSWDIPESFVPAFSAGRLPYGEFLGTKKALGEAELVRSLNGQKFLLGEMPKETAQARGNIDLLNLQLQGEPSMAYNGGFGEIIAKVIRHPARAGAELGVALTTEEGREKIKEAARFATGEAAQQIPNMAEVLGSSAKGAAVLGGGALAITAASLGTAGAATPAAVAGVAAMMKTGAVAGTFMRSTEIEAGSTAVDMLDKGFDEATVRELAPIAGVIKGALETVGFEFMTAPFKRVFLSKVLASDAMKAVLTKGYVQYLGNLGTEVSTEVAQTKIDQIVNNIAATAENKPELLLSPEKASAELWDTAIRTLAGTAVLGAPGAAIEGVARRMETTAEKKAAAEMTTLLGEREKVRAMPPTGAEIQAVPTPEQPPAPAATEERLPAVPIPKETLVQEGPFVREYPYAHSIEGKPVVVKDEADDLALHDALEHGGDPTSKEFRAARGKVYHDAGHDVLGAAWASRMGKGPKDLAAEEALRENLYKMTLMLHGVETATIEQAPERIQKLRAKAAEAPDFAPSTPEPTQFVMEEPRKEVPAPPVTLEQRARDVESKARTAALESDLKDVEGLIDDLLKIRKDYLSREQPTRLLDQKLDTLVRQEESIKEDLKFLKEAGAAAAVTQGETLEMKPATLENIIAAGFTEGRKEVIKVRAAAIKEIASANKLTQTDIRKLLKNKNIGLMGDVEFQNYLEKFKGEVAAVVERKTALRGLQKMRKEKALKREQNIRALHKLPPIHKMTTEQLRQYAQILSTYELGDEPLTPKRIKALETTEFAGAKTMREVLTKAAERLNVPLEQLQREVQVKEWDVFAYDTLLATKNPTYAFVVERMKLAELRAAAVFQSVREELGKLGKAALASRERGVAARLAPTQPEVMRYLEADGPDEKLAAAAVLTPEELKFAEFLETAYEGAYNYLVSTGDLQKSRFAGGKYAFHARRPISEIIRDVPNIGIKAAVKEFLKSWNDATEKISAVDNTGKALGLRKFFKQTLFRSGEMTPSQNVVRSATLYFEQFFRKKALDEAVPAIETLLMALHSQAKDKDDATYEALSSFIKEYLNAKKGNSAWMFKKGGKVEAFLRFGMSMMSLKYIALNMALQISAPIGEHIGGFMHLGAGGVALAKSRKYTKQGKAVLKKYLSFTGESPLAQLARPGRNVEENVKVLAFGVFQAIRQSIMEDLLLGNMTKEEFAAGEISTERLAQIKLKAGRWIDIHGSKSIRGSSVVGAEWAQFKGWAIPPLVTITEDLEALVKTVISGGKKRLTQEQGIELYRLAQVTAAALLFRSWVDEDQEDDSFLGRAIHYARREVMSLLQSLDPTMFIGAGVFADFLVKFAKNVKLLATMEEYQTKEGLKGVEALKKQITPAAVKQFQSKDEEGE